MMCTIGSDFVTHNDFTTARHCARNQLRAAMPHYPAPTILIAIGLFLFFFEFRFSNKVVSKDFSLHPSEFVPNNCSFSSLWDLFYLFSPGILLLPNCVFPPCETPACQIRCAHFWSFFCGACFSLFACSTPKSQNGCI